MKNLKSIICFLLIFLSVHAFAQDKKVVLVSFYGDKKIGGTGLGLAAEKLIDDPSFNLKPIVDKAYERFINEFAKDFPFQLEDKSVTAANKEYQDFKSPSLWDTTKAANKFLMQFVSADNLIIAVAASSLGKEENRDQCNLMKIFSNDDGVMLVWINYEIESRLMGVAAGVTAYIEMSLYNKKCEKVFTIREAGKSSGKVPALKGIPVMKPEKILPLCEDATEVLFEDLKGRLGKIVKKSTKL